MGGEERRNQIIHILETSDKPVPGTQLSRAFSVSRQVIVQDIAIIRANGNEIMATNRGYLLHAARDTQRTFKVYHEDEQVEEELLTIVDCGGKVKDVFVYHKVYGIVRADMNIKSRLDVQNYMEQIQKGKSSLLKNVTSGYHYHTIIADNEDTLNLIQKKLQEKGLLAKLQDYEPIDFWA